MGTIRNSKELADIYNKHVLQQGEQVQVDNYYEPKEPSMKRRIALVLGRLNPKPGEKILDIGCGVGTFAFHASKSGAIATGIDYSSESIEMAKKLAGRYQTAATADFVVCNAVEMPFSGSSFDKVVSADFIEHISSEEKERVVKEIYRILKPGGIGVVFTPNGLREKIGNFYHLLRHKMFKEKMPVNQLHFGLTVKREFENILNKQGFSFELSYEDIIRPYMARLPLLKEFLALNLLWVIKK